MRPDATAPLFTAAHAEEAHRLPRGSTPPGDSLAEPAHLYHAATCDALLAV